MLKCDKLALFRKLTLIICLLKTALIPLFELSYFLHYNPHLIQKCKNNELTITPFDDIVKIVLAYFRRDRESQKDKKNNVLTTNL